MRRLTVDSRLLGAALLAAVAALLVLMVTRPPEQTPVLVTATPVAAGTRVGDVEFLERPVVDPSGLVGAERLGEMNDALVTADLAAGVPLVEAVLGEEGTPSPDVVGLELDGQSAVHGALDPGDRVDIHAADSGGPLLASDVAVVAVISRDGALGSRDIGLLLAVEGDLAPVLIGAIHGDGIHLVRRGR